jgi:hypothetical protein
MQSDEPKPPLRFRKLRIAWSVAWGIVAGFLILLWVASYNHYAMTEPTAISSKTVLTVEFLQGQIALVFSGPLPPGRMPNWLRDSPQQNGGKLPGVAGFAWLQSPKIGEVFTFPFGFATVLIIVTGSVTWLRWRFTLRTLLTATTLVAVVLGLAVWAASK